MQFQHYSFIGLSTVGLNHGTLEGILNDAKDKSEIAHGSVYEGHFRVLLKALIKVQKDARKGAREVELELHLFMDLSTNKMNKVIQ